MRRFSIAVVVAFLMAAFSTQHLNAQDFTQDPDWSMSWSLTNNTPYLVTVEATFGDYGAVEKYRLQPGQTISGYARNWPYTSGGPYGASIRATYKACTTNHATPVEYIDLYGDVHFLCEGLTIERTSPGVIRVR